MALRIDIPRTEDDPIAGHALRRILIDVGPPAAVMITFVEVRQSGSTRELPAIQLGDAVGEEQLAELDAKVAQVLRAVDDRGDRASRFLAAIMQPGFVEIAVADLINGGEVKP